MKINKKHYPFIAVGVISFVVAFVVNAVTQHITYSTIDIASAAIVALTLATTLTAILWFERSRGLR